jgi:hypothetical protein
VLVFSVPIAKCTHGEEQPCENQHIRVDHPLQLTCRCIEFTHECWQRHIENGVVQADDEQAEREDSER